MEELKLLVEMVAKLPAMAMWVIVAFFAYKVIVVGSIYGVIRFSVDKLHSWLVTRKVEYKEIRPMLDGMCIRTETDNLIAQIRRIRGRGTNIDSGYVHEQSVEWLREAIDAKIEADKLKPMKSKISTAC